jgi:hypothetical protein
MSDRELLELAAKAAGYEWDHWYAENRLAIVNGRVWNPLTDDGDALRLAVRLRFAVDVGVMLTGVDGLQDRDKGIASEMHGEDPYAATRHAIVRAAAELGRTMK